MNERQAGKLTVAVASELEVTLTRVFDAPRERVFDAWTQPEQVQQWWGQKGSTLTLCEIDLRPGGAWRFVELAADGNEHPFCGEYIEVRRPERLAYTFVYDVEPFNLRGAVVTQVFEALDGDRTQLVETVVFETVEDRDAMIESGMERGASESAVRLDAFLAASQGHGVVR